MNVLFPIISLFIITYLFKLIIIAVEKLDNYFLYIISRPIAAITNPILYLPFSLSYLYVTYKHFVRNVEFEYHILYVILIYSFLFIMMLAIISACYKMVFGKEFVFDMNSEEKE